MLVDDEVPSTQTLEVLLRKHCPEVEVVAVFNDSLLAMQQIPVLKPDLVFLDIHMPMMDGLQLSRTLSNLDCAIIFTTAHSDYALEAFRVGAIDYLMKPVDESDLMKAVAKVSKQAMHYNKADLESTLRQLFPTEKPTGRIPINTVTGIELLEVNDIIYARSESNYTHIITTTSKHMVSRTLKDVEQMLSAYEFLRIHKSNLIHLTHLKKVVNGKPGYVIMSNGDELQVSKPRREALLKAIHGGN